MVLGAKQRSLYELTDAISAHDRIRALALLQGLLNTSDAGEDAAIGHLYMLARTFRQMLVILEKNVRDSRAIWQALWQGFRIPPFAADDLIARPPLQKPPRTHARAQACRPRRPGIALVPARQTPGARALGLRTSLRASLRSQPGTRRNYRLRASFLREPPIKSRP